MELWAGQYHYAYSTTNTADLYIDNAIIKNSCIVINGYKCPIVFITQSDNQTQYDRRIYVSIIIPTLTEPENWIKNSPEGSTVITKTIISGKTSGINTSLLKDSVDSADLNTLKQYGLSIVYIACGGKGKQFGYMSQDSDPKKAYPPPATFNLPTFFGIYNVEVQETLYAFWKKYAGEYIPWAEDNSKTGGGDGDWYDDSSDTISLPDLTALNQNSISNTKFLTCYKMTPTQLSKLGDELWSDNIFTQISNTVLKPTDFIVNLSLLPVDVGGVTKLIKAGKILLNGADGTLIAQQFIRVDCGSLEVKKKWGASIDYQTDVSIFLPFIGEQRLNANEVMGASLNIIYTVDILSGSCIASVRVIKDNLDAVLYQFTGNMASNYPITSTDYATVFSGALQLAVGVGSLPSSGGVLSLVSATSNMLSGADVKRTGSLSSASGFMGIKKPYLIIARPIQALPADFGKYKGYQSNITKKLSDCKGYTEVEYIHLDGINRATSAELAQIESLLKGGVIIS